MLIRLLALLAATTPYALGDVLFTAPSGKVESGTITISWKDSGTAPLLTNLAGYSIELMVGGAGANEFIAIQATNPFPIAGNFGGQTTGSMVFSIPATAGPSDANAYFLQITSAAAAGFSGQVINYSERFTISGMTGAWPAGSYQSAFKALAGATTVPATVNSVASGAVTSSETGSFAIPYLLQTGLTKYAPMQIRPGTSITKVDTAPQYPTSAFVVATAFLAPPIQVTTLTQGGAYPAVSSRENTASPAPMPSNDMQKFLARWRD